MNSRREICVLETEDDYDDDRTQCSDPPSECEISSLPDAQDLNTYFEEDNEDVPIKRKAEIVGDQKEESLVASKIRRDDGKTFENFEGGTKNNTEDDKHEDKSNSADREPDSQSESEDKDPKPNCAECLFDKELDKRNYYFGNLIVGELQFVPPCMRSVAYIELLKYIDSLKRRHRNE